MFGQDFTCPALLEDTNGFLPVRGCHPLWPDFPDGSGSYDRATGLVRVRSPLLTESRLMSFPPGTEMFQFPGFASARLWIQRADTPLRGGLPHSEILGSKPARGSPRLVAACHVLHRLLAPRHPPDALAFLGPPQRQPHHPQPPTAQRPRPMPSLALGPPRSEDIPATTTALQKALPPARRTAEPAYPCHVDTPARQTRTRVGGTHRLPVARHAHDAPEALRSRTSRARATGISHHHHTMSKQQALPATHGLTRGIRIDDPRQPSCGPGHGSLLLPRTAGSPTPATRAGIQDDWWAWADLNGRPHAYQACALTS